MWAFLFLAGLFSGWWGALSFAAPPAQNSIIPSISSTSKYSPIMTSQESQMSTEISRTLPFALTIARRNTEDESDERFTNFGDDPLVLNQNHLEPYRFSTKRYMQPLSKSMRTSSRRRATRQRETERVESVKRLHEAYRFNEPNVADDRNDVSSIFRHDSLPRLRYGKDIIDDDASTILEQSSDIFGNNLDDRIIPTALRDRRKDFVTLSESRDPRGLYQDANLELDNFMNYQVTPTSLRNLGFDHQPTNVRGETFDGENSKREEFRYRKRVVNSHRIILENVRDYRRRHQIATNRVYSDHDRPRIEEDILNERPDGTALAMYSSVDEPELVPNPYHTTQNSNILEEMRNGVSTPESAMERPRVTRAASDQNNQTKRKRTKANSPREQRRQGRNKERRGQNWCPDADIGNRAYLAPTVFEGKARSMSSVRKPGSNYAVTFEVKQVYKSQPGFQPLLKNDSVRLHFRDKLPGKSTLCGHSDSSGQDSQSGIVKANIKRGKVYLVFVSRVGPRNFTILGEPMIRSKKNAQAVQAVIRPDYVREVTLSELRDAVARLREKVKLVCRTRGSPPPRVHWLKDGVPLHPRQGLRIQHKRRRSKVVIASAKAEDSGQYECVAESTSGHRAALAAELLVTRAPETTTAAWPLHETPCPISEDFCMNGGTCLFFETVGEPACRCAEGFTGLRCENKDVTSTGSAYSRHRRPFSCKLGLSISYYC